mgnify:CR=1 FL=1
MAVRYKLKISPYHFYLLEPVAFAAAATSGTPAQGELFTVKFLDGRKELGKATFYRYQRNGQNEYFARTESTIGLVKLVAATAESTVQDAEKW